ncbi:MAG TPA: DUF1385 domain-containing protein [Gaiellaceae bacterium]|nr:DUF1385 domain-containing protein [Gaiellaceae bacterium]
MQGTSLAALFDRADSTALPALGGMARPDGVVIASERFFAFAGRDGSLLEGEMPKVPRFAQRVPLLRGIAQLGMSVSPLLRRGGVAGQLERLVLFAVVLAPIAFVFLPSRAALVAGIVMSVGLIAWLMRGRTLYLHGAEHRAIAAAEERLLGQTWDGEARPSRFSLRCGTNFVALVLPMSLLADRLWPFAPALWTPVVVAMLSLGLTMELWRVVQDSTLTAARAFLAPGLALQRLTTREPTIEETRIALTAVASVVRRELG